MVGSVCHTEEQKGFVMISKLIHSVNRSLPIFIGSAGWEVVPKGAIQYPLRHRGKLALSPVVASELVARKSVPVRERHCQPNGELAMWQSRLRRHRSQRLGGCRIPAA